MIAMAGMVLLLQLTSAQPPTAKPKLAGTCDPDPKRHVPYSAEFAIMNVAPGSDGDLETYNYSEIQAFDSRGRYLGMTISPDPNRKGPTQTIAFECDPTTNTEYLWDSLRRRLVALKMPGQNESTGCWESEQGDYFINFDDARRRRAEAEARVSRLDEYKRDPNNASPLVEDLGTRMLQGVQVEGTRTTYPPAKSSTDPEPPYVMEEHWSSPLLGIWLEQEVDYPASRAHNIKWSRKLANLSLNEPEPSTFEPPRGYAEVTETMHKVACEGE